MPKIAKKTVEVPNQVFIGCPWKTVRPKYERLISDLEKSYPISFVIVGRDENQDAKELLEVIKGKLLGSSYAIFDATGGNANVSLEYGFAEGADIPRVIYLGTHGAARRTLKDSPIIADLAGKNQLRYAQLSRLKSLLSTFAKNHAYTKRFERFLWVRFKRSPKGKKKRARALALKVIHYLDEKEEVRREDIVQELQADHSHYGRGEIEAMLKRLHSQGLIECSAGRFSSVVIR
jgi:hypothetical protein